MVSVYSSIVVTLSMMKVSSICLFNNTKYMQFNKIYFVGCCVKIVFPTTCSNNVFSSNAIPTRYFKFVNLCTLLFYKSYQLHRGKHFLHTSSLLSENGVWSGLCTTILFWTVYFVYIFFYFLPKRLFL